MKKPRGKKGDESPFPYVVTKNGRTGTIYLLGSGRFKTHFIYQGEYHQNTFATVDAAVKHLEDEFSKLDSDLQNSQTLFPVQAKAKEIFDLEQILADKGNGATLREAVQFYLLHFKTKKLDPKTVSECAVLFINAKEGDNDTKIHLKTLNKHINRFKKTFGARKIHEISALEVSNWLNSQIDEKTKGKWSAKTRKGCRGSLVTLSLYAQEILKAIPEGGKTEFQKVKVPKEDPKDAVEIYTSEELKRLFIAALTKDKYVELIPILVIGNFLGLRPFEIHGEDTERGPLLWDDFIWSDDYLHVRKQKVRSKADRDVSLNRAAKAWLEPYKELKGKIWNYSSSHDKRMGELKADAKVQSIDDGYRHSYASYRYRQIKDLSQLAHEMGNSPRELIGHYKRNVTDKEAEEWFSVMPSEGYVEKVRAALCRRQAALNSIKPDK